MKAVIGVLLLGLVGSAFAYNATDGINPPLWKQCDSRWGGQQLGTCSGTTICSAGCAMTSVAMYLSYRGWGGNPGTLDKWLTQNGGYAGGCNIYWGKVDALGYTKCMGNEWPTYQEVCNGVNNGHGIVICVHNGGHYVLVTGCLGNNIYQVNDPGYSTTQYSHGEVSQFVVYH